MPKPVSMWRDERGFLHESEEGARNADAAYEKVERRAVIHGMLVDKVQQGKVAGAFDCSASTADWIMASWPTLKAIGFAFRLDDFVTGEAQVYFSGERV